jgi:hypothetical protein
MKNTLRGCAVATAFALTSPLATAQAIPPTCQQFITVMKVCGADLVHYTEIMKPDQADATRKSVDDGVQNLTSGMRDAVRKAGVQKAAERCADPAIRAPLVPAINNIMTALSFGDAASEACQDAYGRFVAPTLGH